MLLSKAMLIIGATRGLGLELVKKLAISGSILGTKQKHNTIHQIVNWRNGRPSDIVVIPLKPTNKNYLSK